MMTRAGARAARGGLVLGGPRALGHQRRDPRLDVVQLGEHGHDLAQVVRVEGRELGLERRLLLLDRRQLVAQAVGVGGGGDELVHRRA